MGGERTIHAETNYCSVSPICYAQNPSSVMALVVAGMEMEMGLVVVGHPLRASPASPSLREGEENGVLCCTLDSGFRRNDGGYAQHPCAGMTVGVFGNVCRSIG